MKAHYLAIVRAAEANLERLLARVSTDERNLYCGGADDMTYLIETTSGIGVAHHCAVLYSCPESKYYRDASLLIPLRNACDMLLRAANPDGTTNFLATNYYTPATFELQEFCRGYKCFVRAMQPTEEEKAVVEQMRQGIALLAKGCLNGGFHTPNHRWVESAAMLMAYNILGWPQLLEKVHSYVSEGIDCDEYGEFTERSIGSYNPINCNSMLVMAEEGGMDELLVYVQRNMDLTFDYLDSDGTLFTKNSRRQDSGLGAYYPGHNWYYLYLWAGSLFGNARYLKYADQIWHESIEKGLGTPAPLWLYLEKPFLQTYEPDVSQAVIPESYHAYYPHSNILRVRKGDCSYTLVANNPDFLHVKFGQSTMTLRMCASFFAVAQFAPAQLEKTDTGYRMRFRAHGEYKGLFPQPPATSDWFEMDHTQRPVIHPCDLNFTLDVTDLDDGVKLDIRVDNTPRVPFKLEFSLPVGTRLETNQVIMDTTAGGSLAVKDGDMRLEDIPTGAEVTVRGLFAEHMYHRTMRGSLPPMKDAFSVYATSFSPVDRSVELHFSKRTHARSMDAPV